MEHTTNYNLNKPLDSENYDIAHQNENMDLIEEALTEISTDYLDKATYDTNKNGAADKADKLTTARTISLTGDVTGSGKFDGSANLSISAKVGTTAKTTPVDADSAVIIDSAASSVAKRTTWANIKAFLKTYFGTLYARKPADITSTSTNTSVADGTTTHTHALALGAVTNTKMATMPANTIKGNDGTTALAPQDLTAAEVWNILRSTVMSVNSGTFSVKGAPATTACGTYYRRANLVSINILRPPLPPLGGADISPISWVSNDPKLIAAGDYPCSVWSHTLGGAPGIINVTVVGGTTNKYVVHNTSGVTMANVWCSFTAPAYTIK